MSEVINKESSTAQVTLYFKTEEKEFTITRKVSSNSSSYYLDDKKVTKTEVQTLLKSFGIDLSFPERFIILQHNTVQIAHKKPLELMEHLEKLIGTFSIKEDIDEINKKVEDFYQKKNQVQEKVYEIEDKIKELGPRVEKFNHYLSDAENFENERKDYYSKCKEYSKIVLEEKINEIKEKEVEAQQLKQKMDQLDKEKDEMEVKIKQEEKELKLVEREYKKVENDFQEISKSQTTEKFEREKIEKTVQKEKENLKFIFEKKEKQNQEFQVLNKKLDELRSENTQINDRISCTIFDETEEDVIQEIKEMENNEIFIQLQKKDKKWKSSSKLTESSILKIETQLNEHYVQKERVSQDYERFLTLKKEFKSLQLLKDSLIKQLDALYQEKSEAEKMNHRVRSLNENLNEESSWISKFKQEIEYQKKKTKLIYGTLNELATVDKKYHIALNTILYSQIINSVVVESKNEALNLIKEFSDKKIGVISCIILKEQDFIPRKDQIPQKLISLSSVITTNSKFQKMFDKLTQNWFIAKDRDDAMEYSFENGKIRRNIVTLEGEVFKSNGEIRSKKTSKFHLSIPYPKMQNSTLISMISSESSVNYDQVLKEKDIEIQKVKSEIQKIKLEELENQINSLSISQNKQNSLQQKIDQYENEKKRLERELKEMKMTKEEEDELKQLLEKNNVLLEKSKSNRIYLNLQKKENENEITKKEKEIEKTKEKIKNLEIQAQEIKEKLKNLNEKLKESPNHSIDFEDLKKERTKIKKKMNKKEKELNQVRSELKLLESKREALNHELKGIRKVITDLKKIEGDLQDDFKQFESFTLDQTDWIKKIYKNKEKSLEVLKQIKFNLFKTQEKLEQDKKKVSVKDIEQTQEYQNEKQKLLEEYQKYENEMTSLYKDRDELTIERFENFHDSCKRINENIQVIFQELNPYSNCYLSYPEDKIGAFEEGVVINCKTDGTWKSFNKLSGGQQALCACAISLSFQQVFTSPIFFYDEIDASLDTLNTEKLSKLLKKMPSQFICISLRPNMYESANELIGVYQMNNTSKTISKIFQN